MSSAEQPIASSFNTFQAFLYGELVSIAYNMYDNDPNKPDSDPSFTLPAALQIHRLGDHEGLHRLGR